MRYIKYILHSLAHKFDVNHCKFGRRVINGRIFIYQICLGCNTMREIEIDPVAYELLWAEYLEK